MPEIRNKFEKEFAPKDSQYTKGLKVDEVVQTKDNLTTVAGALGEGKMPTSDQITGAIDSLKEGDSIVSEVNLSATGQKVADRVENLLDSTKQLVEEKNKGDVIQRLIHHAKLASQELDTETPDVSKEAEDSQKLLRKAYNELLVISKLTVTNNEFRSLLADLYNLVRDVLKDNVPGAEHLPTADDLTDKQGNLDTDKAKRSAEQSANKMADEAHENLDGDAKDVADKARRGDTKGLEDTASKLADKAAQELAQSLTEEAKKQAGDAYGQAKKTAENIVNDLQLSEEQKENLSNRLVGILDEVQTNRETQRAIEGLLNVLAKLRKNALTAAEKAKSKAGAEVDESDNLQEASRNAKKAVENFAGGHSLDKLFERLYEFAEFVEKDKDLNKLMHENHEFMIKSLKDNKFVHQKDYTDKAIDRFEKTRDMLLNKYRQPVRSVMDEASGFMKDLKEDPTTNRMVKDLDGLTRELFLDANGKPTIKYDLLQDFQKFVPVLSKRLELLEIPRISEQDDDNEYILDNIKLSCSNIVPKTVRVRTDTEFDTEEERIVNAVSIKMQGIQAQAREVAFYYKRKVLLMNMEDAGLVDVVIPNDGMDIFLKLAPPVISTSDKPNQTISKDERPFRVLDSRCRVNEINIKFQHTKFGPIYKLLNKVIQSQVKRDIEKMVGEGIRNFLEGIETTVTQGIDLGNKDKTSKPLDPSPEGWKSDAFNVKK
ncbi:hypothetical protein K502DRAFT_335085 [Neoconidiobolus thromboides FSU 785]|nr:hypothetical protein K502DRAFT_335085 [Neoconidiobolus thromboides FSU 785]